MEFAVELRYVAASRMNILQNFKEARKILRTQVGYLDLELSNVLEDMSKQFWSHTC